MGNRLAILAPLKAWGGIERKMVILCREFLAQGVQPEFILTRGGQIPYPDEFPREVEIVDLRSGGKLDTVPKLIRHLRKSRPDALLTAKDHAAKAAVIARRLGRLEVPVFIKVTNTLSQTLRRPMKRRAARWLYPWADCLIANSTGVKEDLVAQFGQDPARVQVIYNPTVTPDITERAVKQVEHPWFATGEPPVFLGVGRLTAQKDFRLLVEAFAGVRQERPCRLVILGEGEERTQIEEYARRLGVDKDVALPGYVPDPIPWMAGASVFVLSSRYEGLPNALIEAMAAGTSVVSTDCPSGSAEILQAGRYGRLVSVGDAQGLTEAMAATLDAPSAPSLLHEAVERFRSDRIARQYLEVMGLVERKT